MTKISTEPQSHNPKPLYEAGMSNEQYIEVLRDKMLEIEKFCNIYPKSSDRNACLFHHNYFEYNRIIKALETE